MWTASPKLQPTIPKRITATSPSAFQILQLDLNQLRQPGKICECICFNEISMPRNDA